MFFVIHKRELRLPCLLLAMVILFQAATFWESTEETVRISASLPVEVGTVAVIDAGHGGEDGGAVAQDGTRESEINLAVARELEEILLFAGAPTVMIRREDVSLHDAELTTIRQQKTSDLRNRVKLLNSIPGAVLISIHQNSLPSVPSVHGAQVFYNEAGETLALELQNVLNREINTHREKVAKPAESGIYLMKNAACPAVLVECGFLSNGWETQQLKTPLHQRKLALMIAASYLRWAETREE